MKIKPKPRITRKQKAYLKWMGYVKPKKLKRCRQNKHLRHIVSEFVLMCRAIETEPMEIPTYQ